MLLVHKYMDPVSRPRKLASATAWETSLLQWGHSEHGLWTDPDHNRRLPLRAGTLLYATYLNVFGWFASRSCAAVHDSHNDSCIVQGTLFLCVELNAAQSSYIRGPHELQNSHTGAYSPCRCLLNCLVHPAKSRPPTKGEAAHQELALDEVLNALLDLLDVRLEHALQLLHHLQDQLQHQHIL